MPDLYGAFQSYADSRAPVRPFPSRGRNRSLRADAGPGAEGSVEAKKPLRGAALDAIKAKDRLRKKYEAQKALDEREILSGEHGLMLLALVNWLDQLGPDDGALMVEGMSQAGLQAMPMNIRLWLLDKVLARIAAIREQMGLNPDEAGDSIPFAEPPTVFDHIHAFLILKGPPIVSPW